MSNELEKFAFCNYYDPATAIYHENVFVRILENTHEKSAVPRYKVIYHGQDDDIEFYVPRDKVRLAQKLNSLSILYLIIDKKEYNVIVEADFYKDPQDIACHSKTPHVIKMIKLNDKKLRSIDELATILMRPNIHRHLLSCLLEDVEY
jgi:hypothetical protein